MKTISIVTPCYNEEENVRELYTQVKAVFAEMPGYVYEHIFIDNASKDKTVAILKDIAKKTQTQKSLLIHVILDIYDLRIMPCYRLREMLLSYL